MIDKSENRDIFNLFDHYCVANKRFLSTEIKQRIITIQQQILKLISTEYIIKPLFRLENLLIMPHLKLDLLFVKYVGHQFFQTLNEQLHKQHPIDCYCCGLLFQIKEIMQSAFEDVTIQQEDGTVEISFVDSEFKITFVIWIAVHTNLKMGLSCRRMEIVENAHLLVMRNYRRINSALNGDLDKMYRWLAIMTTNHLLYVMWQHYVTSFITSVINDHQKFKKYMARVYQNILNGNKGVDDLIAKVKLDPHEMSRLTNKILRYYSLDNLSVVYRQIIGNGRNLIRNILLAMKEFNQTVFHELFYLYEINVILCESSRSLKLVLGAGERDSREQFDNWYKVIYNEKESLNQSICLRYFKVMQYYEFNECWMRTAKKVIAFINKTSNYDDDLFMMEFIKTFDKLAQVEDAA